MKASELIKKLQELVALHGDADMCMFEGADVPVSVEMCMDEGADGGKTKVFAIEVDWR